MKDQLLFQDLESLRSLNIKSEKHMPTVRGRRTSESPANIRSSRGIRQDNYSSRGIRGQLKQHLAETLQPNPDFINSEIKFIFPLDRLSTQRKPIFSSLKAQPPNIKFVLPELHQYTPEAKSKLQVGSITLNRQSLNLSFHNEELGMRDTNDQKDDTLLSGPQMLPSTFQFHSRVVTEPCESVVQQKPNGRFTMLALIGLLIAYCFYVTLK